MNEKCFAPRFNRSRIASTIFRTIIGQFPVELPDPHDTFDSTSEMYIPNIPKKSRRIMRQLSFKPHSIAIYFFCGISFCGSFFGMFSVSTPSSNFALISSSVIWSPT